MVNSRIVLTAMFACAPAIAGAAPLFEDAFDGATPTTTVPSNWKRLTSSGDTRTTFNYDYSADGIPSAPHTVGGTTRGLKMEVNFTDDGAAGTSGDVTDAITLLAASGGVPINFTDTTTGYRVRFDMWINQVGPFPAGGAGSTQYMTGGIGHNGTTLNRNGVSGSGAWFAVDGEGGFTGSSAAARDFMAYRNSALFIRDETDAVSATVYPATGGGAAVGGAQDHSNSYYQTEFGGKAPPAAQTTAAPAVQTGSTSPGTVGFRWVTWEMVVQGTTVTWTLDDPLVGTGGLVIAVLDSNDGAFPLTGAMSIGFNDPTAGVSAAPQFSFGLVDNVEVTLLPEPGALTMLAVVGLCSIRKRRR